MHIHAEGPAFFAWLPKMFGKRVVVTVHGIDWQREKWQSGLGSKFIHQGEKNAVKYADEVIVLSKGVQDYFKETYGRMTSDTCLLYTSDAADEEDSGDLGGRRSIKKKKRMKRARTVAAKVNTVEKEGTEQ